MAAANPTITTFAGTAPPWSLASLDSNFANIAAIINSVNTYEQYAADTGTTNAFVVAYAAGVVFTLAAGVSVTFKAANANTASATLAAGGTAAKTLVTPDGLTLTPGVIPAGAIVKAVYDGTNYQVQSILAVSTSVIAIATLGRLTLTSGTPVMTSNVSGATTIYFTPYRWNFTELSQATTDNTKSPAAVAANSNYDLFVWSDAGTIRCTRGPAWTSDTARGAGAGTTELTVVNGLTVNKNAITNGPGANQGVYVGTVRSNAGSTIDWTLGSAAAGGGQAWLAVWNNYNRVSVNPWVQDSTASWTYQSTTVRSMDNSNTNRISFIMGLQEDWVSVRNEMYASCSASTDVPIIGLALDATNTLATSGTSIGEPLASASLGCQCHATYQGVLLGWHFVQAVEKCNTVVAACTFFGAAAGPTARQQMSGQFRM